MWRRSLGVLGLIVAISWVAAAGSDRPTKPPEKPQTPSANKESKKELFTGKVVLLREAFKRRGIEAFDEMQGQVALETSDGRLIPIVSDWRGRAFFQDKRLRNRKVELVGYIPQRVPYLKVLMVFTFDEQGRRMYTDYWCDICSIPMYEIKPCECCQGPIELRFQPRELPDYVTGPSSPPKQK